MNFRVTVLTYVPTNVIIYVPTKLKEAKTILSPRTGRPVVGEAKDVRLYIRISKEDDKKLDECANKLNTNKSDIIRRGITEIHEKLFSTYEEKK